MKIITLTAVAILAVLVVGVLISLDYGFTLQPQVEITSFTSTGTSSGPTLGVVNVWFVLNLTNIGIDDVENLNVAFSTNVTIESHRQIIYTNSTYPNDTIAEFNIEEPCPLGNLKANETKIFMFYWAVSVDSQAPPVTATVKSNEVFLDQAEVIFPSIPNVKITNFVCLGKWHGTRLGGAYDLFSLSYTNLGNATVEYLTVTLNTSKTNEKDTDSTPNTTYNPNEGFLDEYINGESYTLESLKAGETKTLEKTYFIWGAYKYVEPFELTATLISNDTILDQATIMIPISTAATSP